MPRTAKRPAGGFTNRTDLAVPKLPQAAAPGQVYGQAGAQLAAQQTMPMGAQPGLTPGGAPAPAAPAPVQPGQFGALNRPTERPQEPLTAGAPFGPGPMSTGLPQQAPTQTGADTLNTLAQTGNPALAYLASVAGSRL